MNIRAVQKFFFYLLIGASFTTVLSGLSAWFSAGDFGAGTAKYPSLYGFSYVIFVTTLPTLLVALSGFLGTKNLNPGALSNRAANLRATAVLAVFTVVFLSVGSALLHLNSGVNGLDFIIATAAPYLMATFFGCFSLVLPDPTMLETPAENEPELAQEAGSED
ncbi:hypothetical protein HMPREF0044_1228 [Gleimia coleocanis DSM 15436]|uniref:Uncharacterized protein n=1 Tax=Gleimia coleocanis DSM 15436 TaxID=525245 RepID=C0W1D8_9ACTO|nr:hypothetical protein [Gleimia coleocanis]EEH63511.1 hypothetical protein HMPREF0044_1228 [Gleimia coleocanis DSM 15436]